MDRRSDKRTPGLPHPGGSQKANKADGIPHHQENTGLGSSTRPLAQVLKVTQNPDFPNALLVTVLCPLCGETHHHGIRKAECGVLQHRANDCSSYDRRGKRREIRYDGYWFCVEQDQAPGTAE